MMQYFIKYRFAELNSGRLFRVCACMILLLAVAGTPSAIAGQKGIFKKAATTQRRKPSRKARFKAVVYRPPVLDTTCIDTLDEVKRTMIEEINKWSSVKYK